MKDHQTQDPMARFWVEQAAWSNAAFGPESERGPAGPLKHLVKEVQDELLPEIAAGKKGDLVEYADLQFLVFDACRRAGWTYDQLTAALFAKLEVNKNRTWSKTSADEPVEHVR